MKGNDQEMALCMQVKIDLRTLIGCQCLHSFKNVLPLFEDTGTGVAACMQKVNTPSSSTEGRKIAGIQLIVTLHTWLA